MMDKSDLKVWYGFRKLTKKLVKHHELMVIFENSNSSNDRKMAHVERHLIAYERYQTIEEAAYASTYTRSFTTYSLFIDKKPFLGDFEKVLEANFKADEKNVSLQERTLIKEKLRHKYYCTIGIDRPRISNQILIKMSKNNQTLEVITIGQIDVSKTNPRKHFDEKALKELSESIKEHGILQPILVRPIEVFPPDEVEHFELVCGERRYRAAILAGLNDIPVNIRILTDDEAFELQIVENLERKDVHPLDEADAFQKMIDSGKYNIADIAAKMAKPESFIAQRLKLVDLIDEVREHFIAGKLGIGHAVLIARCNPIKQMSIYDDAKPWQGEGDPDYGTVTKLKEDIEDDSYDLTEVKFDLEDADLVKGCGACSVCPKRSGANPVLFADMQEDRCFDETCFNLKEQAHIEKEVARIINNGEKVVIVAGWSKPSEMVTTICKQFNVEIVGGSDWVEDTGRQSYNDNWQKESVKAFCVSGGDVGEYKNVFLKANTGVQNPTSSNKNTTGPISNEEVEAREEIQKIQDRQKRALELDGEKVWDKIRATDKSEIKTKSNPLSQIELNALCFAMIDKLGYSGNSDVKKLVGDFDIEFARTGDFTSEQFNQISRIFYAEILPTAFGSHDNVRSNQAYYKVIKEYYDGHVSDIELEQKAIADKRIERANEKIEALNSKIEELQPASEIPVEAEEVKATKTKKVKS